MPVTIWLKAHIIEVVMVTFYLTRLTRTCKVPI